MITDDKTCSCTSFPMVTNTSLRQCGIVFFICKIDENLKSQIIVSAFSTRFLLENNNLEKKRLFLFCLFIK